MEGKGDLRELSPNLSDAEREQVVRGGKRLMELGAAGKRLGLRLLCDAEYTYMNPGISAMVMAMMAHFNQGRDSSI
jgi:hypothetical protein